MIEITLTDAEVVSMFDNLLAAASDLPPRCRWLNGYTINLVASLLSAVSHLV